jgi:hypothetical protein
VVVNTTDPTVNPGNQDSADPVLCHVFTDMRQCSVMVEVH